MLYFPPNFTLTFSGGFAVLEFDGGDASVEGPPEHFARLAEALEEREECRFKRCACEPSGQNMVVWSPKNSVRRNALSPYMVRLLISDIRSKIL